MTNTKLLEALIRGSGIKKKKIAEVLGISMNALKKKVDGKREFKASEIQKMCALLEITSQDDKEHIFFAV